MFATVVTVPLFWNKIAPSLFPRRRVARVMFRSVAALGGLVVLGAALTACAPAYYPPPPGYYPPNAYRPAPAARAQPRQGAPQPGGWVNPEPIR